MASTRHIFRRNIVTMNVRHVTENRQIVVTLDITPFTILQQLGYCRTILLTGQQ